MGQCTPMDCPTCPMGQLDIGILRWGSGFLCIVPPVPRYSEMGRTVGYVGNQMRLDSYNQAYSRGQWIGWTVNFHGQSSLSHVTVG